MEINIRDWLWRRSSPSGPYQISEEVIGSDIKETLEISKNTLNAFKKKYKLKTERNRWQIFIPND